MGFEAAVIALQTALLGVISLYSSYTAITEAYVLCQKFSPKLLPAGGVHESKQVDSLVIFLLYLFCGGQIQAAFGHFGICFMVIFWLNTTIMS